MSFFNDDEKREETPVVGGASPFKKASSFGKSTALKNAAGGLMDRIKNMSRKDMAFVAVGLSVLVAAPVAQYMISKPPSDNLLTPGFGSREGAAGGGLYEPGINALSEGSPNGSGEVITPLTSRDPASLILGAPSSAPPPPPPPAVSMRDTVKDIGRASFAEAVKSAPSPTPIPKMAGAMRSFGSFFGGGENTRTTGGLSAGKSAKRSMLGPVAMAGYKGVASNTPNSASKGAFEKMRSQADKAASNFWGDGAVRSLDKAAADSVDLGRGAGGMGPSEGTDKVKGPSNSSVRDSRSFSGETLDQMAARMRMQNRLQNEFDTEKFKREMVKNFITEVFAKPLTEMMSGNMRSLMGLNSSPAPTLCWNPKNFSGSSPTARDCLEFGAKSSPIIKDKDGKLQGQDCLCGWGTTPTYDKPTAAGPQNPAAPAASDPDASAIIAQRFAAYDRALKAMVEDTVAVSRDPGAAGQKLLTIDGGFTNLEREAGPPLEGVRNEAKTALDGLKTALGPVKRAYDETASKVSSFGLRADVIKNSDRLLGNTANLGEIQSSAYIQPTEVANIKRELDSMRSGIDAALASYRMDKERAERKLTFLEAQLTALDNSRNAVVSGHGEAKTASAAIKNGEGTPVAKLKRITGRLADLADGPIGPDASLPSTDFRAAPNEAPPMRNAVALRGADWPKLWGEGGDSTTLAKPDSMAALAAEAQVWSAVSSNIGNEPAPTVQDPAANMAANVGRAVSVRNMANGARGDLANMSQHPVVVSSSIAQAKERVLALGVHPCYFDPGNSCGGTIPSESGTPTNTATPTNTVTTTPTNTTTNNNTGFNLQAVLDECNGCSTAQAQSYRDSVNKIARCYSLTNGFNAGPRRCNEDIANRLRTMLSSPSRALDPDVRVDMYSTDTQTACDWVRRCRADIASSPDFMRTCP